MQLAVVAALTPNNKPLVLHIKLQNPRSASTYKSLRIQSILEYLTSLTGDSTEILQKPSFYTAWAQSGHLYSQN